MTSWSQGNSFAAALGLFIQNKIGVTKGLLPCALNQNGIQEAGFFGVLAHSELQRNVSVMDVGQPSQGRQHSSVLHGFIGCQLSLQGTQLSFYLKKQSFYLLEASNNIFFDKLPQGRALRQIVHHPGFEPWAGVLLASCLCHCAVSPFPAKELINLISHMLLPARSYSIHPTPLFLLSHSH
jgi:hypothetical protein